MILRETGYTMDFPKDKIKLFEERVLSSGLCDVVLPMSFRTREEIKHVTYDCSGYVSLRDLNPKTIREMLEILEKTLITISKSTEFLISPNKILITKDTVFYNLRKRNVRMAYMPAEEGNLWTHMSDFIKELMDIADDDAKEYLGDILKEGLLNNYNIRDMVKLISEQKRMLFADRNS